MRAIFSPVRAILRPVLFLILLCLPIVPLATALGTPAPHRVAASTHADTHTRRPALRPHASILHKGMARPPVASLTDSTPCERSRPEGPPLRSACERSRRLRPAPASVPRHGSSLDTVHGYEGQAARTRSLPITSGGPVKERPHPQSGACRAVCLAVAPMEARLRPSERAWHGLPAAQRAQPAPPLIPRLHTAVHIATPYAALLHTPATTPPVVAASPYVLPAPPVLARAAFLYDVSAGRVLYAWNARTSLAMASTTKIMTALLAIKYGRLDDWVIASNAAATIGQSSMYLQQGEQLRLVDLLYGLLLPSGNDAAIAIAEHVGGSQAAFVAMMNREAAALGMTDTHYVNPYGLDAPGHATSARDLARLALAAMQYPLFRQIVSTRYYNIPATTHNVAHDLININQPLWWYPGTIGVKPGTTGAAGRCAVEWVVRGNRVLLLVVLGDVNLVTDVRDLLNWGFGDFSRWYSPLQAPVVYAPEYFGWDWPGLWVGLPNGGRYYVRSGHTVQPPLVAPYLQGGGMARYGPPSSEQFLIHGVWAQRFAGSWLFYNPQTRKVSPYAQEVR